MLFLGFVAISMNSLVMCNPCPLRTRRMGLVMSGSFSRACLLNDFLSHLHASLLDVHPFSDKPTLQMG